MPANILELALMRLQRTYRGAFYLDMTTTKGIKIPPPYCGTQRVKVRADPISKRGFIFSRNLSLKTGFYFFQEISAIFLFFPENLTNFVALFEPLLDPFLSVSPCKTPKIPPKIFARFARKVYFPSNLKSGFYFFQKSQQSQIRGFIFSRNLTNVSNPGFA